MTALSGRGRAWRTLRAWVLAEERSCALCGRELDTSLPRAHPRAPQVDHIIPVLVAPELTMVRSNLRAVCRICNLRRGTAGAPKRRPAARRRRVALTEAPRPVFGPLSTSQEW